ncbi:MAG: hypothetical protein E6J90_50930 [Deltaproteobacteria bacterium]|nr:MAG: hypothetical protein E6J90_50930 [Deltaproteobacteria bacterium]TMQ10212.1 MAG: hypothetical protein E6J91_27535 [Deltaproteobacteria bacterium]
MTTARTTRWAQLHAVRRRACTPVGVPAPRLPTDCELTLIDLRPGPTREQLADQVAALQAQNAWLQRQLEMRFEVLTLTVAHASFADASAVLDGEVARWPTDPYGRPVDEHAPQVAEGGGR